MLQTLGSRALPRLLSAALCSKPRVEPKSPCSQLELVKTDIFYTTIRYVCSVEILIFGGWPAFQGLHTWHIINTLDTKLVQAISELTSSPVLHPRSCWRVPGSHCSEEITAEIRFIEWIADYKADKLQQGDKYVTRMREETERKITVKPKLDTHERCPQLWNYS